MNDPVRLLNEALPVVLATVERANAVLMRGYRTRPRADRKGEIDFVTEFDKESEAVLAKGLAPLGFAMVLEESGGTASDATLYVDPLDGTTNFLHGHPFFCVSVGLLVDDAPCLGVVSAPALGITWVGIPGARATRNGEPCITSQTSTLNDALLATGFPYDRRTSRQNNFREYIHMKARTRGVRRCGSAAIDLCLVGDGTYDGYWESKLNPWDLVGGSALVLAAGGRISAFDGGPVKLREGAVLATNGPLHETLVHELPLATSFPEYP